jgi:hypothetical protein
LNVGDFRPKTRNLFPKNFKMIHSGQDNSWRKICITLTVESHRYEPNRKQSKFER